MRNCSVVLVTGVVLALSAPVSPADGQSRSDAELPTVAVMDFTGFLQGEAGNSAPVGKAVTSMLVTELADREGFRVIERSRLRQLLDEQNLALSGRIDEGRAIEVGRMIGVRYMVFGNVTGIADRARLDVRAVNVETAEVLEVQKLTDDMESLLSLVVRTADLFTEGLELEPPSSRDGVEEIPVEATIHFSRAVDYEDRGETERAIELYRRTLEVHPGHREARKALERLESTGG